MSQKASPTRRVLGEKDANAFLKVLSPRSTIKPPADASALLSPLGKITMTHASPQLPHSSPRTGRKRRISEVDEVENDERRCYISASQQTLAISDVVSEDDDVKMSSGATGTEESGANTSLTSFNVSQQPEDAVESQFELPADEMSQTTLEKMHEVPLPQNSSQPEVQPQRPRFRTQESQLSSGMSSFIDFGGSEASQISNKDVQREVASIEPSPSAEEEKKALIAAKAADLRTRLQFAYFKVQTNQTTTPFSRLKVPESMKRSPQLTFSPPMQHPSNIAARTSSLEERISAARARATDQFRPPIHPLTNLPFPKIPPPQQKPDHEPNIPSSPPLSRASADPEDPMQPSTQAQSVPVHSRPATQIHQFAPNSPRTPSIEQLSSPPPSQHSRSNSEAEVDADADGTPVADLDETPRPTSRSLARDPPSSAIKGEIADSLLQLMRGVGGGKGMCGM